MTVHRTLPTRDRSMIGAWCFADHYGPDTVEATGGMNVPPHPHTGLQTVSWLFVGEIEHRDSAGVHAMVLPGELNLMSAGRGISHSEVSTPGTDVLHGVQLWVALPDAARNGRNGFQHHAPSPIRIGDATAYVFVGSVAGASSPVETATPLLGAEVHIPGGAEVDLDVDPAYEHGVLLDTDALVLDGTPLRRGDLGYVGTGRSSLHLENPASTTARVILLGGTPFEEDIVMWWNFVGRTHEEIVEYRAAWEARDERPGRFGTVGGWAPEDALPAPPLPSTHLKPRRRRNS